MDVQIEINSRLPSTELRMREKLGLEDTVAMMQCNRLQWFVHMLQEGCQESGSRSV